MPTWLTVSKGRLLLFDGAKRPWTGTSGVNVPGPSWESKCVGPVTLTCEFLA